MRKILILDSLYPEMIKVKNETKNKLESEFFGTGKMYQYYLEKIGYKVEVEYFNYPKNFKNEKLNRYIDYFSLTFGRLPKHLTFLQKYTKTFRRVRTTINIFEPDVILIQDLNYLNDFSVKYLKNRGIRIIGEIASPLPPTRMLINYDLIISDNEKNNLITIWDKCIDLIKKSIYNIDKYGQLPIHKICNHKIININIIELLVINNNNNDTIKMKDNFNMLPIHLLCCKINIMNIDIIKKFIEIYPESLFEVEIYYSI